MLPSRPAVSSVHVAGTNDHAALCVPLSEAIGVPTRVLALRSQFVRSVCAGECWSACCTSASLLVAWGAGELPQPIGCIPSGCPMLACTSTTVYFLTDDGKVFSWLFSTDSSAPPPSQIALPMEVDHIACGTGHALALSDGGLVLSWGRGAEGQLGDTVESNQPTAEPCLFGPCASRTHCACMSCFCAQAASLPMDAMRMPTHGGWMASHRSPTSRVAARILWS